jgi:hypothetical protein
MQFTIALQINPMRKFMWNVPVSIIENGIPTRVGDYGFEDKLTIVFMEDLCANLVCDDPWNELSDIIREFIPMVIELLMAFVAEGSTVDDSAFIGMKAVCVRTNLSKEFVEKNAHTIKEVCELGTEILYGIVNPMQHDNDE